MDAKQPNWKRMDVQTRHAISAIREVTIPSKPGVYAWYKDGVRKYVGATKNLQTRLKQNHLGKGASLGNSAFRRNVAEHLDFGIPSKIKDGRVLLTVPQILKINAWITDCQVAWIVCSSEDEPCDVESMLKREFLPPLTKR